MLTTRPLVATLVAGLLATVACACDGLIGAEDIHIDDVTDGGGAQADGGGPGTTCTVPADCPPLSDSPAGCSDATCAEGRCVYTTRDADGDGDRSAGSCSAPGALIQGGGDCDDLDPNISSTRQRPCAAMPDGTPIVFPGGRPQGECRAGTQACDGPRVGACEGAVAPATEACEGTKDESCDGAVDEGCTCTGSASRPCGIQVGACKGGMQNCSGGTWGACVGGKNPEAIACDGLDHDCDGTVDTKQEAKTDAADVGNACLHLFVCPAANRREVCSRSGIGYTYYCDGTTRRTLGFAPFYSLSGTPNPAPPGGFFRIANNATATKVGPYDAPSTCCGSGGCQAPAQSGKGIYVVTDMTGTQLYTASP